MSGTNIALAEILERIPHRAPFLFIARAEDFREGQSIVGVKDVTGEEPFFAGHFPGNPVMPGVLIVEAMAQTAGWLVTLDRKRHYCRACAVGMSRQVGVS